MVRAERIDRDELYILLNEDGRKYLSYKDFRYMAKLLLRSNYKDDARELKELKRLAQRIVENKEKINSDRR